MLRSAGGDFRAAAPRTDQHVDARRSEPTGAPLLDPDLARYGWNADRAASLATFTSDPTWYPARVIRQDRGRWTVVSASGERYADLRGRLRSTIRSVDVPTVGDWVLLSDRSGEDRSTIESVLPRSSALLRNAAGTTTEPQVVAANVDTVFITVPSDAPENPRRLERQLALVRESGATPVIVATKADLSEDIAWMRPIADDAPVCAVDGRTGAGVERLSEWLGAGQTVALLGPSGAGKSTLGNVLLGDQSLLTGAVRDDDKRGRHTTSWRQMVVLPSGALLVDTPGVRELALWSADDGVAATFTDVEEAAGQCRFNNCSHGTEPGCAIVAALADGTLDPSRFESWKKLQSELKHHAVRHDARLRADEKRKWVQLTKDGKRRARP